MPGIESVTTEADFMNKKVLALQRQVINTRSQSHKNTPTYLFNQAFSTCLSDSRTLFFKNQLLGLDASLLTAGISQSFKRTATWPSRSLQAWIFCTKIYHFYTSKRPYWLKCYFSQVSRLPPCFETCSLIFWGPNMYQKCFPISVFRLDLALVRPREGHREGWQDLWPRSDSM